MPDKGRNIPNKGASKPILGQRSPKIIRAGEAIIVIVFFVWVKVMLAYYWLVKIKQSCYNAQDKRRKLTNAVMERVADE